MPIEARAKFRPKELAIILSHYDLGPIKEIHSFRRGNLQSPKSLIVSERGRFVLKRRAPGNADPYRVGMAQEILFHLKSQGYAVPGLIATRDGRQSFLRDYGAVYELFEYLEGSNYDNGPEQTASSGSALCELHGLMAEFRPSYQVPSRSYHNADEVRQLIGRMLPSISKHESSVGQDVALNLIQEQLLGYYQSAAEQACRLRDPDIHPIVSHGDWHPGNMIFHQGRVAGVFDFDAARYLPPLEDVANGCLQFSLIARGQNPDQWPTELDSDRARAFLLGYRPGGGYSELELGLIVALMIEALIAETVAPIAKTGHFASVHGFRFLKMIVRKIAWMEKEALSAIRDRIK